jgi:hypothetical protein
MDSAKIFQAGCVKFLYGNAVVYTRTHDLLIEGKINSYHKKVDFAGLEFIF